MVKFEKAGRKISK